MRRLGREVLVRVVERAGGWLVTGLGSKGANFAGARLLPKSLLVPLQRDRFDPVPRLRKDAPIQRIRLPIRRKIWLVTGHAEAKKVLADTKSFSNDFANFGDFGFATESDPGGLGMADPPNHTRLRKMVAREFTVRRLERLRPMIKDIVDTQLDHLATLEGPVDLLEHFAMPIPALTICELLGVPYSDRDEFQRLSTARFDVFDGASTNFGTIREATDYLRRIVAKQRVEPGEGLLGQVIKDYGDEITDDELAGLADGLLTGGLETTASMLALGALTMLQDADFFASMRDDDAAVDPAVEELLRYMTVVQVAFLRFARADVEVGGIQISDGDIVIVSLSGANRDPALGSDMEQLQPDRTPTQHVAFGYGAHRCVGAELARMELRMAYPALVRRFPNMRLAVGEDELQFRGMSIVYGLRSLPVFLR